MAEADCSMRNWPCTDIFSVGRYCSSLVRPFPERPEPPSADAAGIGLFWNRSAMILSMHMSRQRCFRVVILTLIAIFLVWEVITRSFVAYLADVAPEIALQLRPADSAALSSLAEAGLTLARSSTTSDLNPPRDLAVNRATSREITEWAKAALLGDPLDARPFRVLGQLADDASDAAGTERLMQAAVRRSLRESAAVYWLMRRRHQMHDYGAAIGYADTLLRTRPELLAYAMPTLSQIAESKDAGSELSGLLGANPPWRRQFFELLPNYISDARTPLNFFLGLRDTAAPPSPSEFRSYLDFLIHRTFYELAYYTWLQLLPTEQLGNAGLLFNGDFELAPSGLPFDWIISAGSGVTATIATRPDRDTERALFIEFGHGRVDFPGISQITMLAPGAYKFQGKYRGDIAGRRGLRWRVTCAGATATLIGESAMVIGKASPWKEFEFSFSIPKTECRAQYVRLALDARSPSEQFVSGSIWYDELRIARAE
jgi:hypothetical protein